MTTLRDLLRVVHQWAADELPGLVPSYVVIRFQNCDTKMQFPVPPAVLLSGPVSKPSPPPTRQEKPLNDEETVLENGEAHAGDDALRLEDFEHVKPGAEEDIVSVLIAAEKPLRAAQIAVRAQSELTDHFRRSIYSLAKKEIVKNVADNRYWLVVRPLPLTS